MAEHGGNSYRYHRPIVDFSANINPLGVPASFKQALQEKIDTFALYPEPTYQKVKQHVKAYLKIESDGVVLGNGAVDLIYRSIQAAAQDRVYALAPTFSEYHEAAALFKMDYCAMPVFQEDYLRIDYESMLQLIRPASTVVLCNPNNPTGTLLPQTELIRITEELAARNCYLIIDETFIEFTDYYAEQTLVAVADRYPNLFVIRAATKFFGMPGLRFGYGVTVNQSWRDQMQNLAQPWQINTAAVIAAETIFNDWEYIQRSHDWIRTERSYLYRKLTEFPQLCVYPSQANFYLLKLLSADRDAYQLKEQLLAYGILIRTTQGFDGLTPDHFRVAVKDRKSNDFLLRALSEIL